MPKALSVLPHTPSNLGSAPPSAPPVSPLQLSVREQQVLALFARGCTTRQAAKQLGLSPLTIKWYSQELYRKLGVHNRAAALMWAVQHGALGAAAFPSTPLRSPR